MSTSTLHAVAADYLRRLRQAGRKLPADRLHELLAEIEAHLSEAIPPGTSEHDALDVLERLGAPGEIVEAEQPPARAPIDRGTWREWAAVILLPLGGFAFGIGWLAGLILLWSSRLWTTRDKLIGTLIVPGGIATALPVSVLVHIGSGTQFCRGFASRVDPATGALVTRGTMHCTGGGGPSGAATALLIALLVFVVIGPIVSAVYLARRAGRQAPYAAASPL
jgi:hypothetical protein